LLRARTFKVRKQTLFMEELPYFDKLISRFEVDKICGECKRMRAFAEEADKKGHATRSAFEIGTWSHAPEELKVPVDVLIVAEGHGGGNEHWSDNPRGQFDVALNFYDYSISKERTFFNLEVCRMMKRLDELEINWFFTDMMKCFVSFNAPKRKDNNFCLALQECRKHLVRQVDMLKPKVIVCLGNLVSKNFGEFFEGQQDILDRMIPCKFPSQMAANSWVKDQYDGPIGEDMRLIKEIRQRLRKN